MHLSVNYSSTMNKIKNIKQLKEEKKRIKQRQEDLEKKISGNWLEVKDSLRPVNIAKQAIGSILVNKTASVLNGGSLLKSALTFGLTLMAKKFTTNAGEKIGRFFKK